MKKIFLFSVILLNILYSTMAINPALAAEKATPTDVAKEAGASADTCDTNNKNTVCIKNPLGGAINTPQKFIGRVIQSLLGVIGSIALVMFVLGGFTWMTSAGDKAKVTKGRDTMLWAVLGLTVVFSSYALVKFVIQKVGG